MELNFETKTVRAFRECLHRAKRTQLSMEQVVPDVNDDIGRIYSVQPSVLLKSKDMTAHGAAVTGELHVALLYINELENKVFDLHVSQGFSLDFDLTDPDPDIVTQIKLFVSNAEARALNPRKVSVSVEVCGELTAYAQGDCNIATEFPENETVSIYTSQICDEQSVINAVCEKTFVLNEQFPFPQGKPNPDRLVSEKIDFHIGERQLVGSKVLVKGTVSISTCYLSDETDYPSLAEFSAPFSQLIDIGQEAMDCCSLQIEATSLYVNLIDTINGEKALDAEIHAVMQLVSRFRQPVQYISDAYSLLYPSELEYEVWPITQTCAEECVILETDEKVELPEDCEDVLTILFTVGACALSENKAEASVWLDVLYRNRDQALSSARRMLTLSREQAFSDVSLREARLLDSSMRNEGNSLNGRTRMELLFIRRKENSIRSAVSMTLQEDAPYDTADYPSITAVRVDDESVWELAKEYHSSCEKIEALNDLDGQLRGRMLLIPKGI